MKRRIGVALVSGLLLLGGAAGAQEGLPPQGCCCGGGMGGGQAMRGMCGSGMGRVTVERTNDGTVIRMTGRNAEEVKRIQQHAEMMRNCMAGGRQGGP